MRGWSASGTPIRSQMIATGSTDETSPTNSTSPLGAMASTIWRARRRTDSSAWATERGVNPRFTSDRRRVCLGGSVEIIERIWKRSTSSGLRHHLDTGRRAERLPVAAGGGDVGVAGERPEPATRVGVLVPGDRALATQAGQRPVDVVPQPEVEAPRVDLVDGQRGGWRRHRGHRVSSPSVRGPSGRLLSEYCSATLPSRTIVEAGGQPCAWSSIATLSEQRPNMAKVWGAAFEGRQNVISLHTCGKALGASGALIGMPKVLRDFMVNRCQPSICNSALPFAGRGCPRRADTSAKKHRAGAARAFGKLRCLCQCGIAETSAIT